MGQENTRLTSAQDNYQVAIQNAVAHQKVVIQFIREQMVEGKDFGTFPGTKKPVLLKSGAEKLCRLFQLRPHFELVQSIVNFDEKLFHYHYKCRLIRHGESVGEGEGNANSRERRYAKQQDRIFDLSNTICKMAQKRSLVAAVLATCGASEIFEVEG